MLVVLAILISTTVANFHFSIPQPEVRASLYSDVLLPCTFTDADQEVDLNYLLVIWKQDNNELLRYQAGQKTFSNKFAVFESELQHGNASLLLRNITVGDEGGYECEVIDTPDSGKGKVNLKVTAAPKISLKPPLVVMGESNPLECHADDFYPEEIFFEWLRDSRLLHLPVPSQLQKNSDGTFSAVSLFFYTPTNDDTGVLFCCRVKHDSWHEPLDENFLLMFRRRPSVTITPTTLLQGEEQAIMCKVDGYYPDDIIVTWRRNGKPLKKIEEKSDGTFVVSESFMLTPKAKAEEEEQETFSCEVKQEGFAEPLIKNIQFKIEGKPRSAAEVIGITIAVILVILLLLAFLFYRLYKKYHRRSYFMSDIIVPSKVFVGQEVTLECFIDRHFREEPTWWIKGSNEWENVSCDHRYVIKNTVCKSSILHWRLQNGNDEEQSLINTQSPQKRHTTLTFVTDLKKHANVAFKCQITRILLNPKKEVTRTKETKLRLLAYPSISAIKDISVFPNEDEDGMLWIKASDFYPKEIRFNWPDSVSSETQSCSVDKHGLYSTYSQCKVPMERLRDPEFVLQVDITHDSLEVPCSKRIRGGIPAC
ncbi:uncharacterized protein LOC120520980 [Polypterus senegalus]|uniref:uncharacterized protein LOC120520980 n=1 Tax=Polypterus senegalus TaxID=55291 RepID=UPI001966B1F9|nr:uncharacterized protein LOC120520980 [Polypterus senegalus]